MHVQLQGSIPAGPAVRLFEVKQRIKNNVTGVPKRHRALDTCVASDSDEHYATETV